MTVLALALLAVGVLGFTRADVQRGNRRAGWASLPSLY
jgi:hypothetical protein